MEKPIITYHKKVEKTTNKMRIPKVIIDSWGDEFLLDVFENYIKLTPIKKNKKEGEK